MRDLLSTRRGRLTAFCLLYVTEGMPQGFTAVAVATEMRRQGLSPAAIGTFVATLYLPWSWKWAMGPVVDLVHSDRLGRRRPWIVGAQLMMAVTLLAAMPVDYATRLSLFTCVVLVHIVRHRWLTLQQRAQAIFSNLWHRRQQNSQIDGIFASHTAIASACFS